MANVAAAKCLTTSTPKHCLAAASRSYYALYQACIAHFELDGKRPGDFDAGQTQWKHTLIQNNLGAVERLRRHRSRLKPLFDKLRNRREVADYGPDEPDDEDVIADLAELEKLLPEIR